MAPPLRTRSEFALVHSSQESTCRIVGLVQRCCVYAWRPAAVVNWPMLPPPRWALRLRGVVEQKTYPAGCTSGAWSSGGVINGDPYNVYRITVSSPAQTYYVNAGTSNITHTWALDYQQTFRVDAGA